MLCTIQVTEQDTIDQFSVSPFGRVDLTSGVTIETT